MLVQLAFQSHNLFTLSNDLCVDLLAGLLLSNHVQRRLVDVLYFSLVQVGPASLALNRKDTVGLRLVE